MITIKDLELDFNDILILPKTGKSELSSRNETNLIKKYACVHSSVTFSGIPIIAANMDGIGTFSVAEILTSYKIFTALHKFYEIDQYIDFYNKSEDYDEYCFYSMGNNDADLQKFKALIKKYKSPKLICLDAANGYIASFREKVKIIRDLAPKSYIMAGNVVDSDACTSLVDAGASCVKVGIGSGAHCMTRIVAGVGRPQLSTILDCVNLRNGDICSDGGCVSPGDIGKALGAGSDFVMLGSMLAGSDESESTPITESYLNPATCKVENKKFVIFYGMSSTTAMKKHNSLRGYRSSEGRVSKVECSGPISKKIDYILGGIRSTLTYVGCNDIKDLPNNFNAVRVSGKQTHNTSFQDQTIEDN
jgi:GMP reductase